MDGYTASTYGDRFADVYDDWYGEITDADACAEAVASLARRTGGSTPTVVELGVGTGRLAFPLADQGLRVVGIDASEAMLERLRGKPGADRITLHCADLGAMAALDLAPVGVALLAFNTLFNLTTEDAQLACLRRCAEWLDQGGSVVIEAFVPAADLASTGRRLEPTRISADEVVLTVSEVLDDGHTVLGQHIHVSNAGITLRPWNLRMLDPDALDALCAQAGLTLTDRWSDWDGTAFGTGHDRHVSVYGLAPH